MDWQYESLQRDVKRLDEKNEQLLDRVRQCERFPHRLFMGVGLTLVVALWIAYVVLLAVDHPHH